MENINREAYIDDLIATAVEVDPAAMYFALDRMNSKINATADCFEKDPMLTAHVNEIIEGIDQCFMNPLSTNFEKPVCGHKNDLDRWIDAQPDLKFASEHPLELVENHVQQDFVWFEKPFDLQIEFQTDMNFAKQAPLGSAANNVQADFVWFESSLDRWLETQPDLKLALEQLNEAVINKADNNDLDKWIDVQPDLQSSKKQEQAPRDKVA